MMNSSSELRIQDYIGMVHRRKWWIIGCVTVSCAIAVLLCVVLPKSFRSSTTVLIESQKIPESYVKSGVEGSIEGRISAIQQTVMSRSLLSQVAEDFKLFRPDMSPEQRESVIEGMRKKINVTKSKVGHAKGPDTIEGFSISFAHEDPAVAMRITERFASHFIEENLKSREQLLEGASNFLEQELHMAEARLEDQERSISDFKTKYMGELPQQTEANLRSLDRLQLDVNAARDNIQAGINRVAVLEKQVSEAISSASTQGVSAPSSANQGHGGGDPLIVRLAELERTLATLSAEYRETYPDIIQTRQEIEAVKGQLASKYGVAKDEVKPGSPKLMDPMLRGLMRERDEAKSEVENQKDRLRRLLDQVRQYEGRVERAPAREQELMILVRDYDNMQKNYQSLLEKRLNARLAENLEKRQKGEQFRVLDPANLPAVPESPNRPLILLGGLAIGCGLGFGGAFAFEMLRPAFRRPDDAEAMLGIPVLASIPDFSSVFGGRESVRQITGSKEEPRRLLLGTQTAGHEQSVGKVGEVQYASWNLVTKWSPRSMVSEQFRVAATRLTLLTSEQKSTVAVITSALVGEGKTSTAVNLSYILAQELDKKTLLIDCDLKRPMVHAYTEAPRSPGLVDYLMGDQPLDACIHQMDELPLWILSAGSSNKGVVELSKIKQLSKVLHVLRSRFDYIIIDAPPIFPLADLNVLSSMADRMILVIRAGKTGREVVGDAYKTLDARCPANIVLTGVDAVSTPYYMYQYGNYGTETTKHA